MLQRSAGSSNHASSGHCSISALSHKGTPRHIEASWKQYTQLRGERRCRSARCTTDFCPSAEGLLGKGCLTRELRCSKGRRRGITTQTCAAAAQASTTVELFATILGYCVLLGSCTRSVPQIVRIVKNRSADGVSMAAQYAELIAYSITLAYNLRHRYAFSTYGDTATCWLQDIVLIVLIARYRRGPAIANTPASRAHVSQKQLGPGMLVSGVLIGLGMWAMLSGVVSMQALAALQASTIAIIALGGRLPQIMLNARRGNSGELSPLTSILNLAGNTARLFTTAVLTKDGLNMVATIVQTLLNSVLVWQSVRTAMQAAKSQTPTGTATIEPNTA